jgi:rubrerythrin
VSVVSATIRQLEDMIEVVARMIPKEQQSRNVYRETASWAPTEMTRILFERLSQEEEKHEGKLRAVLKMLQDELEAVKKAPRK